MGFCLQLKEPIGNYYGPMYTAVGTGFCGSLTTFSGWELDVFNSWLNADRNSRAGLRDFMDGLGKTVFTLTLALGSFTFGSKLATVALRHFRFPGTPSRTTRYFMTAISVLIWAATFPTYFRLPPSYRHQATAALLFAYPGTLTRYLLSIRLNPALKSFPLGTFAANMLGTALLATFHVLQNLGAPRSSNACALLQGLADGYCGCLTTVSTFAAEVASLRFSKSVGYVLVSWGVGQLILLVILGPSFWAGNVSEQRTCIFP
ncbi:hypothetical protein PTI98_005113 [Pleurotus ostreatus]|nr:hypothetical protein PTI98_005113 [Pleurotus ostreatus]